jgi:hypothetical protein
MRMWIAILIITAFSFSACNKNTVPQDDIPVEQVINSKQYTFLAETANPMGGSAIRLSNGYDLIIKPNEVIATLPYYGRAYTADRNFAGIRFTSTRFAYNVTTNDKHGWDITIQPDDVPEIQEMRLTIHADGYATLYVTSTNRQAISYYGRLERK